VRWLLTEGHRPAFMSALADLLTEATLAPATAA
jgi:hypothetical protein